MGQSDWSHSFPLFDIWPAGKRNSSRGLTSIMPFGKSNAERIYHEAMPEKI